jgi:hypothetical protein
VALLNTAEVLGDYLARADRGDIEGDIAVNLAPDCVLLPTYGRFDGHDGVQEAATMLAEQVSEAKYFYLQRTVHGKIAFLEWTAVGRAVLVNDGADTFMIPDGRVHAMTIHYTMEPEESG